MTHYRLLPKTRSDGGLASPGFSQETRGLRAACPAPSSSCSSASVQIWGGKGPLTCSPSADKKLFSTGYSCLADRQSAVSPLHSAQGNHCLYKSVYQLVTALISIRARCPASPDPPVLHGAQQVPQPAHPPAAPRAGESWSHLPVVLTHRL